MSNLTTKNFFDAGASSATKSTDLTEGIHEDISSDLAREHGPDGMKKPYSLGGSMPGTSGGVLDKLGGSPHHLGNDAKSLTGSSSTMGTSSVINSTEGIKEDASRGIESIRGAGQQIKDSMPGAPAGLGGGTHSSSSGSGGILGSLKENISGLMGTDSTDRSAGAMDPKAGTHSSSSGPDGILSSLKENMGGSGSKDSTSRSAGAMDPGTGSGGILGSLKENMSGLGAKDSTNRSVGAMDAGASATLKNTDLSDGIFEDASKGIESVKGATARR